MTASLGGQGASAAYVYPELDSRLPPQIQWKFDYLGESTRITIDLLLTPLSPGIRPRFHPLTRKRPIFPRMSPLCRSSRRIPAVQDPQLVTRAPGMRRARTGNRTMEGRREMGPGGSGIEGSVGETRDADATDEDLPRELGEPSVLFESGNLDVEFPGPDEFREQESRGKGDVFEGAFESAPWVFGKAAEEKAATWIAG